jgi:segregation and condensation protein B
MNYTAIIEGLLFLSGDEGLSLEDISIIIELSKEETKREIDILINKLDENKSGLKIEFLGNLYKLTTRPEHLNFYQKMIEVDDSKLSEAALETLAIIAYNEPITRAKIDELRGVSTSHIISKLKARELICSLGRTEDPGRPMLYGVSSLFWDHFGLTNKEQLPKLNLYEEQTEDVDLYSSKFIEE